MPITDTSGGAGSEVVQLTCGCCGRAMPANRLTQLGSTPAVRICAGCALWAARRGARRPDLRRLGRIAAAVRQRLLTRSSRQRESFVRVAIPILPSADFERTMEFWRQLGFEIVERHPGYLVTAAGDIEVHFSQDRDPALAGVPGAGRAFIHVRDAAALHEKLRSVGVDDLGPVEDQDYGLREFAVTDPDGNLIRFGSPVPS